MRKLSANLFFWLHSFIIIFWLGLFFVPLHWWPGKIIFHFHLTLFIIAQQCFWGLLLTPFTGEYRMVCFLTTITQLLKGQKISDPENYNHSFLKNFFENKGINVSHRMLVFLAWAALAVVSIQYLSLKG